MKDMRRICRRCGGSGTEPDMEAFGRAVREVREQAGMSLRELARQVGCSPAFVSDFELGRRGGGLSGAKTRAILELLDVPIPAHGDTGSDT